MTRRSIDLDQLFVAVLEGEPWLPDAAGAAIRAGRQRQRRVRALVVAGTAAAVAAVLVALPTLGVLPRGRAPVVVAGAPSPTLPPGAPLAQPRPPLKMSTEARAENRAGQEWIMAKAEILGVAGERAPQVPGMLRAAVLYELVDRHGQASVGPVRATSGDYSASMARGTPLAWADSTVQRTGSGPLPVRVGLWLSHPASWEGCGVGEVDCRAEAFPDDYATVVSYRTATRDPNSGAVVTTWWARGLLYDGLLSTVAVQAPLTREEAVKLALSSISLSY